MTPSDVDKELEAELGESGAPSGLAGKPEIIVVDDDEDVCEALALVLSDAYTVVTAMTGDQGIAALHHGTHAVVLDIRMRIKDGFDTFLEMKKKSPDVPIIFHTAYQDVRDPYEVINDFQPFGYIKKGDDADLRRTLADAVESYAEILAAEDFACRLEEEHVLLAARDAQQSDALAQLADVLGSVAPGDPVSGKSDD